MRTVVKLICRKCDDVGYGYDLHEARASMCSHNDHIITDEFGEVQNVRRHPKRRTTEQGAVFSVRHAPCIWS